MIDSGYTHSNVTVEDDETISLKGIKDEKEKLPNINQLEL